MTELIEFVKDKNEKLFEKLIDTQNKSLKATIDQFFKINEDELSKIYSKIEKMNDIYSAFLIDVEEHKKLMRKSLKDCASMIDKKTTDITDFLTKLGGLKNLDMKIKVLEALEKDATLKFQQSRDHIEFVTKNYITRQDVEVIKSFTACAQEHRREAEAIEKRIKIMVEKLT